MPVVVWHVVFSIKMQVNNILVLSVNGISTVCMGMAEGMPFKQDVRGFLS